MGKRNKNELEGPLLKLHFEKSVERKKSKLSNLFFKENKKNKQLVLVELVFTSPLNEKN